MARDVAYIALGSNLGDREQQLANARAALARLPGSQLLAVTGVEETAPLGPIAQDRFLNQMVALETELAPAELLAELHAIERRAGRVRAERWGPRLIDIDIVAMEQQRSDGAGCRVPHPELPNRGFWQRELAELRGLGAQ